MKRPGPTPTIELSVQRVTCPRHGEPFRARWPKGWPRFTLAVIRALLEEPTFAEALHGDIAAVNAALDVRPACERVPPDVLRAAYRDCGTAPGPGASSAVAPVASGRRTAGGSVARRSTTPTCASTASSRA